MNENEIIHILEHRLKKIKKEYHRLQQEGYDPGTLHDFRTEMKKLKAFVRLLNTNRSRGEKIRIGKKMKDVYRLSGDLRNLQLHCQRIEAIVDKLRLSRPNDYMNFLQNEMAYLIAHLKTATKKISMHQFSQDILDSKQLKLTVGDIERYFIQQVNMFTFLTAGASLNDEVLHDTRKVLKDIGYNRPYLPEALPIAIPAIINDAQETDRITQKLGLFHDLCVSLSFLDPGYAAAASSPAGQEALNEIRKEVIRSYDDVKRSLEGELASIKGSVVNRRSPL